MTAAGADRLPGLDQAAAVEIWDAVQASIDDAHGKLLARLGSRFDAGAIGDEVAMACAHFGMGRAER